MQKLYEAMFIVDSAKAKENYAALEGECLAAITRHGGVVKKAVKWDDRRLCYEIDKVKRGTYILVHFEVEPEALARIERQATLNEKIVRALFLVDEDGIETATGENREAPAEAEAPAATAAETPEGNA